MRTTPLLHWRVGRPHHHGKRRGEARSALAGKRGETEPEDLSQDLLVQLGTITEGLNRTWYERCTGHAVKDVQRRVRHNIHKWMGATLDGRVQQTGAVFEAKFMLPWNFSEEA